MATRKKLVKQTRLDERAEQIRRQQERERRTRNLIIAVFSVLIVGGAAVFYFLVYPPSFLQAKADISPAYSVPDEGHTHEPGCQPAYKHVPPSSGCHLNQPPTAPRPWQA